MDFKCSILLSTNKSTSDKYIRTIVLKTIDKHLFAVYINDRTTVRLMVDNINNIRDKRVLRGESMMDRVFYVIRDNFKLSVVAICFAIMLGVFLFGSFGDAGKVSASTANQKYFICIDIEEGDTLWSIADLYISEEYSSVDEYVAEVKELNDLSSDKIFCGATLVVPYYAP